MKKLDFDMEEWEWDDAEEIQLNEEAVVRTTMETLQAQENKGIDVAATKVISVDSLEAQLETLGLSDDKVLGQETMEMEMPVPDTLEDTASPAVTGRMEFEYETYMTKEEQEELGDLSYHDEDVEIKPKREPAPKKHPGQARARSTATAATKKTVRTGEGRNIKVNQKKNGFQNFLLNLSWMDAVIGLIGVVAIAVLIFVVSFWVGNNNRVEDLGEFTSLGIQLSELETIGQNGINRIVSTTGNDVLGEAIIPADGNEEEQSVMVSVSFTSIEKDLKIKFTDTSTDKLISGVAFELEVVTPSNETLTWKDDDKDGMIYQEGLKAGSYMVIIKSVNGISFPSDATKVVVKDKISYQVINVLDEIKTEDEIDVSVEDTEDKDNIETETLLTDTVKWVASRKELTSGADGYSNIDKATITDPATLTAMVVDGFWKVSAPSESASTPSESTSTPSESTPSESTTPPSESTSTPSESTGTPSESGSEGESSSTPGSSEPGTSEPATAYVTGVTLNAATLQVKMGETGKLTATVAGEQGCNTSVTWTTSNDKIATVKDGVITPVAAGEATITVTTVGKDKDGAAKTATCKVTVVPAGELSLKLNAATGVVLVGENYTIVPTVENKTEAATITYAVDKKEIATVDEKGVVTGVAKGTAVITVTVTDKGADGKTKTVTATVTITVKANPKKDTTTLLKDKDGNQVYIKDANGKYVQAKWADYYTATAFYIQVEPSYTYYGWQTLNGETYFFDENGKKVTGEQVISGVKYNFASDGSLSMNGGVLGIDVSKWQGTIDWNAVKNSGISFVIIRCGYRGSSTGKLIQDPKFESYISGATKAGLKVGLYVFSQAVNEKEAVEEASMAIALAQGYKISYPIFIDTEWTSGGRANNISKETRTAVCRAFCETVKSAGYTPGIYASKSWYQDSLNVGSLTGYKIWLAQYASQPTYSGRYDMWQYTDKGKVNGISTNVDMNISYLGY